jgi:hypothetical protein
MKSAPAHCAICRFDPGILHVQLGPAPGTGLQSPETGSQNRRHRDLSWRQRPHVPHLNPRKRPQIAGSRDIIAPASVSPHDRRPIRAETRATLVASIVRGRRWLDEIVAGTVTSVEQIAARDKCSIRQVNMTISLADQRRRAVVVLHWWHEAPKGHGERAPPSRTGLVAERIESEVSESGTIVDTTTSAAPRLPGAGVGRKSEPRVGQVAA